MKPKQKIGLILTGGGMRCAYSAGALLALRDTYNFTEPYALGAASGSAGNAFYYLAKQFGYARRVWTTELASADFIRKNGGVDIDFLVDTIFKKRAPLDSAQLSRTKTKFFVPITNADMGTLEWVSNKSFFDYFETLRAAKALPIVYGKRVRLGLKRFIDGDMVGSIDDLARKVLATGVTTLITINCEPPARSKVSKLFLSAKAYASRPGLRRAMLKDLRIPPGLCPTNVSVRGYCISPSRPLPVKTLTATKKQLTETFNLGYADVAGSPELQALFHHARTRRKQKG